MLFFWNCEANCGRGLFNSVGETCECGAKLKYHCICDSIIGRSQYNKKHYSCASNLLSFIKINIGIF